MSETSSPQPSPEQLAGFRAGDPVAINSVSELVLPYLVRWALHHYPALPRDDVIEAVFQGLAETCMRPSQYDPARSAFTTYALERIKFRLTDLYRRWKKITENEELGLDMYENFLETPYNLSDSGEVDADVQLTRSDFYRRVEEHLTACERDVFRVMLASDDPHEIAEILVRYGDASEVKNVRAKIKRRMTTIATELNIHPEDVL